MKQVLQSLRDGTTEVAEVPCPSVRPGQLLIRTSRTLVSVGTERMLVEFGKAGWIEKARQQPDKVRMVLDKMKTDGVVPTIESVLNKLDQPLPLGYCNVGRVIAVGSGVSGFAEGDLVMSNGKHAEVVSVPVNLCARVPEGVSEDQAAFTVLASIALQGIRLIAPTLGETVAVTGLGLIGQVAVQLLKANGCRVLGIDFDRAKLDMARRFGAEVVDLGAGEDPVAVAQRFSRGRGVDAVLVTAATRSNEPMHQAALMSRKRGRIILVGVTGLELSRADFYEKELTFQVSCSYGPGRYDPRYEEGGQDYPVGFVRWTEQRNFEAVLDMMSSGRLEVDSLVSHRFRIDDAAEAYGLVTGGGSAMGIVLEYPCGSEEVERRVRSRTIEIGTSAGRRTPGIGLIGSGNYATAILIPAFKGAGARLRTVASAAGVSGLHAGRKFGFERTTTDLDALFNDPEIDAIVIATRHDSHASLVRRALAAGKHVFVEKPLAIQRDEIDAIVEARAAASDGNAAPLVMVGFNRRFAPQVIRMKELLRGVSGPKAIMITINAGAIPPEHWTQDRQAGGGRIIGEGCHFLDLARFLAGSPIRSTSAVSMESTCRDTVSMSLEFEDGSIASIQYLANGPKAFPKERIEVFSAGRVLQLDNFRRLRGFAWPGFSKMNLWRQDKGQAACAAAFCRAITEGGTGPIPFDEIIEIARATLDVSDVSAGVTG